MASYTLAVSRSRAAIPEAKNMFEKVNRCVLCSDTTAGDKRLSDPCQQVRGVSSSRPYPNVSISRERRVIHIEPLLK